MGFSQAPALPYRNLGIVQDGDTASHSIQKDKYVIWKGGNYFAKTDILQGETFVVDTNLTEITEGAINGIADALNASITKFYVLSSQVSAVVERKVGNIFRSSGIDINISSLGLTNIDNVQLTIQNTSGDEYWCSVTNVNTTKISFVIYYYMSDSTEKTFNYYLLVHGS